MTIFLYIIYLIDFLTKKNIIKQVENEITSLFFILNIFLLPIIILRIFHAYNLWYQHINNILIFFNTGHNFLTVMYSSFQNIDDDQLIIINKIIQYLLSYISFTIYMLTTYTTNDSYHDKILTINQINEFHKYQELDNIYDNNINELLGHMYDNKFLNLLCYGSNEFNKTTNKNLQILESSYTNKSLFSKYEFYIRYNINLLFYKSHSSSLHQNLNHYLDNIILSQQNLYNNFNIRQSYILYQFINIIIFCYIIIYGLYLINFSNIYFGIFIFIISYIIFYTTDIINKLYNSFGDKNGCNENDIYLQIILCKFKHSIKIEYKDIFHKYMV